jgi:hypothetical protein
MRFTEHGRLEVLRVNIGEFVMVSLWEMTYRGTYTPNEPGLPIYHECRKPDELEALLTRLVI